MYICRKIAHRSRDSPIQRAPIRKVPPKTHARRANPTIACVQCQERGHAELRVFVVGVDLLFGVPMMSAPCSVQSASWRESRLRSYLLHLPRIPGVRSWNIVGQCFGARKLVIRRRRGADVSLAGDLAAKARDGAGHCGQLVQSGQKRLLGGQGTGPWYISLKTTTPGKRALG